MTRTILRTNDAWWLADGAHARRLTTTATTTGELLSERDRLVATDDVPVLVDDLELVSPVTAPCRVVAQMTNYASHTADAGLDPATVPLSFFRKTSASISGPHHDIVRPSHVRLLDYEVEIGLVVGAEVPVGTTITDDGLADVIAALVVTNDVSARDVQLPATQFYQGKSYPTFTPVGPALVLVDGDDLKRFDDLRLRLWVDGELRQDQTADDVIHSPLAALRELVTFQPLSPGDLVLTGTPVGTALSAPPKPVEVIAAMLPDHVKWRLFFDRQARNPRYLADGALVEAAIATDDGAIDLGVQRMHVRGAR